MVSTLSSKKFLRALAFDGQAVEPRSACIRHVVITDIMKLKKCEVEVVLNIFLFTPVE
jgi:hypothetical protein